MSNLTPLFFQNLEALRRRIPILPPSLLEDRPFSKRLSREPTRRGEDTSTLTLQKGEKKSFLHSLYDPISEAKNQAKRLESGNTLILLGWSLPYLWDLLLENQERRRAEKRGEQLIFIVEPDPLFLKEILDLYDFRPYLNHPSLSFLLADTAEELLSLIHKEIPQKIPGLFLDPLLSFVSPSRLQYQPEIFSLLQKGIGQIQKSVQSDSQTQAHLGRQWNLNILKNIQELSSDSPQISSLLESDELALVAAGPSLETQLSELKQERRVLCCDTALPFLRNQKIDVEGVFCIDTQIYSYHHFLTHTEESPTSSPLFFFDRTTNAGLIRAVRTSPKRKGEIHFLSNPHPLLQYLGFATSEKTGSNVLLAALHFLNQKRPKKIRIYGLDMGYIETKMYPRETYLYSFFSNRSNRLTPLTQSFYHFYQTQTSPSSSEIRLLSGSVLTISAKLEDARRELEYQLEEITEEGGIDWNERGRNSSGYLETPHELSLIGEESQKGFSLPTSFREEKLSLLEMYYQEIKELAEEYSGQEVKSYNTLYETFKNAQTKRKNTLLTLLPLTHYYHKATNVSLELAMKKSIDEQQRLLAHLLEKKRSERGNP